MQIAHKPRYKAALQTYRQAGALKRMHTGAL